MTDDWKAKLSALRNDLPGADDPAEATAAEETAANAQAADAAFDRSRLRVTVERKGRAGKCATIISGFDGLSDEQVSRIAADLRRALATGGSARGGEILVQGDRSADVRRYFKINSSK